MKLFKFVLIGIFAFSFLSLADYLKEVEVRDLALPIYFCSASVLIVWLFAQYHETPARLAWALTNLYLLSAAASLVVYMSPLHMNYWVQIVIIGIASLYLRERRRGSNEPRDASGGNNP